jgi:cell division protein FtsZ
VRQESVSSEEGTVEENLPLSSTVRYAVLGLGGAGVRIVSRLDMSLVQGVERWVLDCDQQELNTSSLPNKKIAGYKVTRGLGTGGDIEVAQQIFQEERQSIVEDLKGIDLLFLVVGLGGGFGSAGAVQVAQWAREAGTMVIAFATLPFTFEGGRRNRGAEEALTRLRQQCHAVVMLPNDQLLQQADSHAGVEEAFALATLWVQGGICSIWVMLERKGLSGSIDFAALRNAFPKPGGRTLFGIVDVSCDGSAERIVDNLLACPLMNVPEHESRLDNLLVNLIAGRDMEISQMNEILVRIADRFCSRENTLWSILIDPDRTGSIQVCVIGGADLSNERYRRSQKSLSNKESGKHEYAYGKKEMPPSPQVDFQGEFDFANQTLLRGYFERSARNMWKEQDLDQPTFLRRGIKIPL